MTHKVFLKRGMGKGDDLEKRKGMRERKPYTDTRPLEKDFVRFVHSQKKKGGERNTRDLLLLWLQ